MTIDEAMQFGLGQQKAGQYQEAERIYRQVLAQVPEHPDALHLLGLLAQQFGRLETSAQLIQRAIAACPGNAIFHSNLGETYRRAQQLDQAEKAARRAVELAPTQSSTHINLGILLQQMQRLDEAKRHFRLATELAPNFMHGWTNLANVLMARGDVDEAVEMGRQAVQLDPNDAIARNNLGAALDKKNLRSEAEAEYRHAVQLNPRFAEAIRNLGSVFHRKGNLHEAISWWTHAIEIDPNHGEAHKSLALAALSLGDFETGWLQYEWRFKCDSCRAFWREYPVPRWTGFDLTGKTILLHFEQGFGDMIQFARFIPQVAARGGRVILQCYDELVDLLKSIDGASQVVSQSEALPPFDTYLPLMSLPYVLGTTMQTLPADIPYINIDPVRKAAWAERVGGEEGRLKVGLAFEGRMLPDPKRSCRFAELAPLAEVEGVTFFSLQKGEAASQLSNAPPGMRLVNLDSELHNFSDTAAALANLDLLISIDTAAAHLAGAIGVPTWTMLPFAADFRWMLDREDCPWYPGMRLFRQKRMDDWTDVVARIRDELSKRL